MQNNNSKIIDKGNVGESRLNSWFQENGLTYFQIKQDVESFMHTFAKVMKRPDFFLLLEGLGMIAVDAKNYRLSMGYFTLNKEELHRALSYEIITKMPFWFAYMQQTENGMTWYWLSAMKALEVGQTRLNGKTGAEFLAISINDFIAIRQHDDIGKLYTNRSRIKATIVPVLEGVL
jgi:hypothetical protein